MKVHILPPNSEFKPALTTTFFHCFEEADLKPLEKCGTPWCFKKNTVIGILASSTTVGKKTSAEIYCVCNAPLQSFAPQ